MGGDFDHRWTQTRESILAMKELWTKPEAEFHGASPRTGGSKTWMPG